MADPQDSAEFARFDELAEEFSERLRKGEKPALQEYVDRWPEMADAIHALFPAMVEVEQVERAFEPPSTPKPAARRRAGFADFRIVAEIGRGGMGIVYEAEQVSLKRMVALKVLPLTMKRDARALERFRREARSAAQLHHTNIVPVFAVGEEGDSAFYAMQFIRGQGLHLVIEELMSLRDGSRETDHPITPREHARTRSELSTSVRPGQSETSSFSPDSIARSLLTGRFVDEHTEAGQGVTLNDRDAGESQEREAGGDSLGSPRPVSARSSAVWPGGSPISDSDSSGRRQSFFRSMAEIARQVAGGLAYAHERGVVHRDIKPANLLLDTAGVAWIADFGLAKSGDDSLTESGDILGTLRFMAPERFRGKGDSRADIYALGVTLYEMITLRQAFDSTDRLSLIEQVRNVEPRRPRSIDPAIPGDLETIVLKAMAKDESARYATASDMAEDLRRFLAGEPIWARRTHLFERGWRWSRRNPLPASLVGLVASLVALIVAATSISARREHGLRIEAENHRKLAEDSLARLREARTDEATFRRAIAFERENLEKDPANRDTQGSLDALISQMGSLQRRTGRKAAAVETALERRELNPGEPNRLYQVAMDLADCLPREGEAAAPGDLDAAGVERTNSLAVETLGRALLAGLRTKGYNLQFMISSNPHFRPLHSNLSFKNLQAGIYLWSLQKADEEVLTYKEHNSTIESVAITPDGQRALTAGIDRTARLWNLSTGVNVFPPFYHAGVAESAAISADGRLAAVGCLDGLISLWNLEDRTSSGSLDGRGGQVIDLALTGDGQTLVSGGMDGKLRVWDLTRRVERFRLEGHQGRILQVDVSRDGRRAVTSGEDGTVRVWDIELGAPIRGPLIGHHGWVWSVVLAPDGRRALSGGDDGCLIEWDIVEGKRLRTLWGQWATIRCIAISPDGRHALSGGTEDQLLYWDLKTGRELYRFPGNFGGVVVGLAISPDGRRVLTGGTDKIARVWSISEDLALARNLIHLGRWEEALEVYTKAFRDAPDDPNLLHEKSQIAWRLGRWEEVARNHETYRRLYPDSTAGFLNSARVLLMAGDRAGYRRLCEGAAERIAGKKPGGITSSLVHATVLAADSGVEPAESVRWAEQAAQAAPQDYKISAVLGLSLLRAGRSEEAIAILGPVASRYTNWSNVSTTWPMLAMAYHHQGDRTEALRWLDKTRALRNEKSPRFGRELAQMNGPWNSFDQWIDFELLAREAEAKLVVADTPPGGLIPSGR
jgi:WD40 repeat protein/serine/threonine protein kinase/thioredoxin-like negative regulator of GroEL